MKPTKKDFDAVKMMRQIRSRLSKKYLQNPESFKKDMEKIKSKYGINTGDKKIKTVI